MKVNDIIYLGDNMAWHVRKPFVDWRGHVEKSDYNGYAKIIEVRDEIITVLGLYGSDTNLGRSYIAHPVEYRVNDDSWDCLIQTQAPENWDYESTLKIMTDPQIYARRYTKTG